MGTKEKWALRRKADEIEAEWYKFGPPKPYGLTERQMVAETVQRARLVALVDLVRDAVEKP